MGCGKCLPHTYNQHPQECRTDHLTSRLSVPFLRQPTAHLCMAWVLPPGPIAAVSYLSQLQYLQPSLQG